MHDSSATPGSTQNAGLRAGILLYEAKRFPKPQMVTFGGRTVKVVV